MPEDSSPKDNDAIFAHALALPEEERDAYLEEACGEDTGLRDRMAKLLLAYGDSYSTSNTVAESEDRRGTVTEKPGATVGRYKLLQQIGEGGFGVVFMAEQEKPVRRKVALKIVKPGMDTKEVIARFEAERQALALMDHPNIARVLDASETETGRPFFVMELVKGVPLTEFCDHNKLSTRERLELFVTVCRAVQHAHQKGVIHRDLKPRNVMVTLHDNKPVPKIIDFGVAKAIGHQLTELTMFTSYGQMIGTPAYMSPEQAQMSGLDIDTRSDIYSLGVILYELMTGTTPLDAQRVKSSAYAELQRMIAEEEPPKPSTRLTTLGEQQATIAKSRGTDTRRLQQFIRGDLDWIVLKALEKERNRRYSTADNFAEDVERFLNDDEVHARPPSTAYRLGKLAKKHKGALLGVCSVAAALIIGTLVSVWQAFEAHDARKKESAQRQRAEQSLEQAELARATTQRALTETETARKDAETARAAESAERRKAEDALQVANQARVQADEARNRAEAEGQRANAATELKRRQLYASHMQLADQLWNSPFGSQRDVDQLLARWIPINDTEEDLREFSWRYQWSRLHESAADMQLDVNHISISPRGNLITASATGIHERVPNGVPAELWPGDASNAILSPDGKRAAMIGPSGVELINLESESRLSRFPGKRCRFSADGAYLIAWDKQQASVRGSATGTQTSALDLHGKAIRKHANDSNLYLSPDGQSVILRGYPLYPRMTAFLGDVSEPYSWWHRNSVNSGGWSRDGKLMASGDMSGNVYLQPAKNPVWSDRLIFASHGKGLRVIEFSADSNQMATGGSDGTIDLWDIRSVQSWQPPTLQQSIKAHLAQILYLTFSHDGSKLASLDEEGVAKLWDLSKTHDSEKYDLEALVDNAYGGRFEVDVEYREDGSWDIRELKSIGMGGERTGFKVGDRWLGFEEVETGEQIDFLGMPEMEAYERMLGRPGSAALVHLEDPQGNRRVVSVNRAKIHSRAARVAFSPDGRSLAIADMMIGALHWSPNGPIPSRRFPNISTSVAFAPGGHFLAMNSRWRDVQVWDLEQDIPHARLDASRELVGPGEGSGVIAYSPDGRFLAIGTGYAFNGGKSNVKVWDTTTLEEVGGGPLIQTTHKVTSVAFTQDSKWLVASVQDGDLRIWDTQTWAEPRQITVGRVGVMALSPTTANYPQKIALGSGLGLSLWDFETGTLDRVFTRRRAMGVTFSRDGRNVVSGGSDHTVRVWDVATGMQLRSFHAHKDLVYGADFSPDGNTLASVGTGGFLNLWKAAPFSVIDKHPLTIRSIVDLASLRIAQQKYADAEVILRRAYQKQHTILPGDHPDLAKTRNMIRETWDGQGKLPVFVKHPASVRANLGEEAVFQVEVEGTGPWSYQWWRNGHPITEANAPTLRIPQVTKSDLGLIHVEVSPVPADPLVDSSPSTPAYLMDAAAHPVEDGALTMEIYRDIPGRTLLDLTMSEKYPERPDATETIPSWEIPGNIGENYGLRLSGYVSPPVTGSYLFYLCTDDDSQLYVSSDDSPANQELVAYVEGAYRPREWETIKPESISRPLRLTAGTRYWVEMVYKQGSGRENLAVAWRLQGMSSPRNGDPPIPGDFFEPAS